jgi:glycosyltransferase involved in cell wall biosynthesis
VYNVEKYVKESINSVLNQTYQDYEVILVDDGSTDDSGKICDIFKEKFPERIRVIHQPNSGLVMARRVAIQEARGDAFVFLDSDDMISSDCLEKLNTVFNSQCCDLIIYDFIRRGADGDEKHHKLNIPTGVYQGEDKKEIQKLLISTNQINNLWIKSVKRNCVDITADYSIYSSVSIGEDILQSLPLIDRAKSIVYLSEPLYIYRKNECSMTLNYWGKQYYSSKIVLRRMKEYVEKWDEDGSFSIMYLKKYNRMCCNSIQAMIKQSKDSDVINMNIIIQDIDSDKEFVDSCHKKCFSSKMDTITSWCILNKKMNLLKFLLWITGVALK